MTGDDERESAPSLPVVDPDEVGPPTAVEGPVAGVLLAAGTSSRFEDGNKLLAELDGEPLVRHAARTLAATDLDPLVAVVGNDADRVADALDGLGFEVVHNPDYADGQATSVRAAVEALDGVSGAVFALGDMPYVDPASVEKLVRVYRSGRASALAAAYEGQRGNPVLFDARYFEELVDVEGDRGGREVLLRGEDSVLAETSDRGVIIDLDRASDFRSLTEG